MTITANAKSAPNPSRDSTRKPSDICTKLISLGRAKLPPAEYFHLALVEIVQHFASPYGAICIQTSASSIQDHVSHVEDDTWDAIMNELLLESYSGFKPLCQVYNSKDDGSKIAAVAIPIDDGHDEAAGAIAIIVPCDEQELAKARLQELRALVSLIIIQTKTTTVVEKSEDVATSTGLRAVAKGAEYKNLHELSFAITNKLKGKLQCDMVAMGKVRQKKLEILSISGFDSINNQAPGVRLLHQVMEECLDAGNAICYQLEDTWSKDESVCTGHQIHKQLHSKSNHACVLSLPLFADDQCVAIVTMTRHKTKGFREDELSQLREMLEPLAPAILLVGRASRSLHGHVADTVRGILQWAFAKGKWGRKISLGLCCAFLLWFVFGKQEYVITVPCTVAPGRIHHFSAPYQGTVSASYCKAGDTVKAGQLLFEMNTDDLELEAAKLRSDRNVTELKRSQAVSGKDLSTAALANAELRSLDAQLSGVMLKLQRARGLAPTDGIVVKCELHSRIGEAVSLGEPLLQLALQQQTKIELHVPDALANDMRTGLSGRFASNAMPGNSQPCKVISVRPASEPIKGKNVFVAEASIEETSSQLRFGMEGVAKIDAGQRPIWWVTLHQAINWLRLKTWL